MLNVTARTAGHYTWAIPSFVWFFKIIILCRFCQKLFLPEYLSIQIKILTQHSQTSQVFCYDSQMFYTLVWPVISYSACILGTRKYGAIKSLFNRACHFFLGLVQHAPVSASICQCVNLCQFHVHFELMFFSTNIQPIDQQKNCFHFFSSSGYIINQNGRHRWQNCQ